MLNQCLIIPQHCVLSEKKNWNPYKKTRRCLEIIINNFEKHNFSKIPRLDKLEVKTHGYILDEQAKDYDTESDSEMSLCESEPEPESKDRPTTSKAIGERGKEKRT